jgi:hypothetical protein
VRALLLLATLAAPAGLADGARRPQCYGAASRDALHRCHNAALDRVVVPTPHQAMFLRNAPCEFVRVEIPFVCAFGAPLGAKRTVALLGDSHATHWRPALAPVAVRRGWHGISMTRAGCPFATGTPILPARLYGDCVYWRSRVPGWFRAHPEVDTVFVSAHHGRVVGGLRAAIRGYLRAWRLLPPSVKRIVVIRDTPARRTVYRECVVRAIAHRERAGKACAMPRRSSLGVDPEAIAARRTRDKRVVLLDLTRFFCSPRHCFPVIGGVLVQKDISHVTTTFMRTMAPYLDRALRRIGL